MTIELPRRKFLIGLGSLIAAPAVVKASSLMPVKAYQEPMLSGIVILRRWQADTYYDMEMLKRAQADYNFFKNQQWNLNDLHSRP